MPKTLVHAKPDGYLSVYKATPTDRDAYKSTSLEWDSPQEAEIVSLRKSIERLVVAVEAISAKLESK